jgi:hypothetical protein
MRVGQWLQQQMDERREQLTHEEAATVDSLGVPTGS